MYFLTRDIFSSKIVRLRSQRGTARTRHFSLFPQQYCNAYRSGKRTTDVTRLRIRVRMHEYGASLTRACQEETLKSRHVYATWQCGVAMNKKGTSTNEWTSEWANERRTYNSPSPVRSFSHFLSGAIFARLRLTMHTALALLFSPWGTTACCEPVPDYSFYESYDTHSRCEKLE